MLKKTKSQTAKVKENKCEICFGLPVIARQRNITSNRAEGSSKHNSYISLWFIKISKSRFYNKKNVNVLLINLTKQRIGILYILQTNNQKVSLL